MDFEIAEIFGFVKKGVCFEIFGSFGFGNTCFWMIDCFFLGISRGWCRRCQIFLLGPIFVVEFGALYVERLVS